MPRTFEEAVDRILSQMKLILLKKRAAYGTENIVQQGLIGVVNRIGNDKLSRARILVEREYLRKSLTQYMPQEVIDRYLPPIDPLGETLEDTLIDAANYCVIAITLAEGSWTWPTREQVNKSMAKEVDTQP